MNKLGFGFLRIPMRKDGTVDLTLLNEMVDAYLAGGRTYFDTAYTYSGGKSELALRKSLVDRYPRESFQIAAKLPGYQIKSHSECYSYFEKEQERCGVSYFDVYMLHWLNEDHYRIAEETGQFDFLKELKSSGKAKRIGFSYHGTADLLKKILTAHPETDCVLLQINYVDWESETIQSRKCYEVAVKHGVSVMVMEPAKGGMLANPPENIKRMLYDLDSESSPYALAFRFAESLPGVEIVLSGMSSLQQIKENIRERDFLTAEARSALLSVANIINHSTAIKCSGCGYCQKGCPKNICIPNYFRIYNELARNPDDIWKIEPIYSSLAKSNGKASDCIGCHQCENHCPQKLPVTEYLSKVAETFEGEK